ncbi:SDR family NAD(P)-dependent oxidoreductase [Nocardioides astragali]|uniref:SDR family NAD(P)-dependent oxidoreductase n=1 Tax=Nocardioides astragali TaxID=1776736 RepID=A0ABW2NCB8_9ACTN|nr:SDR family oxidoreductase [Nocardioides astragali]
MAIVFGGGGGADGVTNGQATAMTYARAGAHVAVVDLSAEAADRTAAAIEAEGGLATPITADATDPDSVESAVAQALDAYGTVDVLHNNVGVTVLGGPIDLEYASWQRAFALNVDSVFLTTKYVLPVMIKQQRGAIVNVSSIASLRDVGYPYPAYMASKAAVNQVTVSLALTHAREGIRANAVAPGFMDTPIVRHQLHSQADTIDELLERRHALSPTGRMGTCWDVANASLFLASDAAAYVNGVCLPVDGGLTMRCV